MNNTEVFYSTEFGTFLLESKIIAAGKENTWFIGSGNSLNAASIAGTSELGRAIAALPYMVRAQITAERARKA